ncbi:hypothetical protein HPB52_011038 [Rhipicephalus sanguineus]|uniref:Gustatory receptor n=1 Tax=Rhipicephalus sanguineus TaxID=34632 RepID=A0A9D4PGA0_RHISA|nr:hypothetical protein HPB52_011038 [Rhipicephalus sanguineus]
MGRTSISSTNLSYLSEFRLLNGFYRYLGYTFVGNDFGIDGRHLTLTRRPSPYTAYVAVTWLVIIGVFAFDASEAVNMYDEDQVLHRASAIVYTVRTTSVQACCFILALTQAESLMRVSRDFADLEGKLAYPVRLSGTARNLIVINVALTVAQVLSIIPLLFFDENLTVTQLVWNSVYLLVNAIHGQSSCLVAYTWAMFFADALAAYVASINTELQHVLDSGGFFEDAPSVQRVHGLFVRITDAFEMCDEILGKFLLLIFPLNLILAAPWCYWLMKEMDQVFVSLTNALGFAALCAQMGLVCIYRMHPYKEAKKTWDVLTKLLVSQEHTPEVFNFCATIERAPRLACLANSFGDLERRLPVLASLKTPAFLIVGLNVALAVLLFVSIVPLLFLFADYTQDMLAWNEFYGVVCLFHGQAACMITYTWIMFYSKTLASYIQAINDQLRDMQASLEEEDEIAPKVLGVDELHRLFYEIMEVSGSSRARSLHRPEVSLINALGCVALCAQMVIVSLCAVLPNKQIQEFRHTCIHQEFRFSALGFFKVGPPLVVSGCPEEEKSSDVSGAEARGLTFFRAAFKEKSSYLGSGCIPYPAISTRYTLHLGI